jgi:phosphoribosyl 1,2-cyclic phosphodiesterase
LSETIQIKFWGVRGSTPCANAENMVFGGNTTCLQIHSDRFDELLIVDCGTGFRNLGNHLTNGNKAVRGRVFITHPHWDHLQGFPFFKPFYDERSWFRVYLPPQDEVGCKEILQGHMSNTFFPVTIDMLEADMECETYHPGEMNVSGYSVDYMWAKHTVQTAMYKFKAGDKVIIFAPDNELPLDETEESLKFIKQFQEFVKDADLLIHDGQFNMGQHQERQGWGHSCWEKVIEVTKGAGIKKLFLTHHDPDSNDEYLKGLNEKVRQEFGEEYEELCFVKEGQVVSLPL